MRKHSPTICAVSEGSRGFVSLTDASVRRCRRHGEVVTIISWSTARCAWATIRSASIALEFGWASAPPPTRRVAIPGHCSLRCTPVQLKAAIGFVLSDTVITTGNTICMRRRAKGCWSSVCLGASLCPVRPVICLAPQTDLIGYGKAGEIQIKPSPPYS